MYTNSKIRMTMKLEVTQYRPAQEFSFSVDAAAALIAETQRSSGEIPWCDNQKTDPWDHVEAAMGLSIAGYLGQARRAFDWLAGTQLADGSWYSAYRNGLAEDRTRDANQSSYVAVGVFHHYLITGDAGFLEDMWPTVRQAIDFALRLQARDGEIYWAVSPQGRVDKMALLTGSSSIYMSLKCALVVADLLGHPMPAWRAAIERLEAAIHYKPHLFNMTKSRFSMDWFYPVLAGVLTGSEAQRRIDELWKKFVIEDQGVRCVFDEPWVTIAETSELALALAAMGNPELARIVFGWIGDRRFDDGTYWCGFTYPNLVIWPEDKITWTNAVALMAADAIDHITPAAELFSHRFWSDFGFPVLAGDDARFELKRIPTPAAGPFLTARRARRG
jgi:MMP endo-(1,4)-3-O-methyl-alpha-D-mannosidase